MKLSEAIEKLTKILETDGDIECLAIKQDELMPVILQNITVWRVNSKAYVLWLGH